MKINNAGEASEIVRDFLVKMGWTMFLLPIKAAPSDGKWIVTFRAGYKDMKFELIAFTGEIIRYETLE